jgi:hypothetical protein
MVLIAQLATSFSANLLYDKFSHVSRETSSENGIAKINN